MKFIYKKIQKEKVFLIGEFGYFKNLCVRILNFKRDIVPYKLDDFDSCNYYDNRIISRKVVEDYFKYMENGEAEKQLLLDYVKRTICYEYEELHAYINFIKSRNNKIVHFYSKRILKNIYLKRKSRLVLTNVFVFSLSFVKMSLWIIRACAITLFYRGNYKLPKIVYLRRASGPDPFREQTYFFEENKFSFNTVAFEFNRNVKKCSVLYLNCFKKSSILFLKSMYFFLMQILKDFNTLVKIDLDFNFYFTYMKHLFMSVYLTEIGSKVIFGSLIERNYGVLIYRNKHYKQKVFMFSDGMHFPPIPGPDYIYADKYYYQNKIELEGLNRNGGNIVSFKKSGFLRSEVFFPSNGISNDINEIKAGFKKVVLVSLATVREGYYPSSKKHINLFMQEILFISTKLDDVLFIVKGKKGEYRYFDERIKNSVASRGNVYFIPVDKVTSCKFNHFEDLLSISDLVVSMHYASTTVWQSLSKGVPAIGYNFCDAKTFFDCVEKFIAKPGVLLEYINFWLNLEDFAVDTINKEKKFYWINDRKNFVIEVFEDIAKEAQLSSV